MDRVTHGLFAVVFLIVILRAVGLDSEWLVTFNFVLICLLTSLVAFSQYDYQENDNYFSGFLGVQIALGLAIATALVFHTHVDGLRLGGLIILYLMLIGLIVIQYDSRAYLRAATPYILGYALLAGVFLYHVLSVTPTSGLALFPVFAAIVLGVNLFILPRYVAGPFFYHLLAVGAALFAVIGLRTILSGEYSIWGFEVGIWGTRSVPLVAEEIPIIQSVFANPNTLGMILFPGLIAAVVEFHRVAIEYRSDWGLFFVPIIIINVIGLYLTNSRASMLAAAAGLTIYGVYVIAGRQAIPIGLLAAFGGILTVLIGLYIISPDGAGNRFILWSAGLEAYLDSPTYLGEGLISTSEVIAPYLPNGGSSVHNSYLSILLRTGIVGMIAYLVLVIGPILHGALRYHTVSPAAMAIAGAFAVHQVFEVYTLYQYGFGSIVGTLAVGYVIASLGSIDTDTWMKTSDEEPEVVTAWDQPQQSDQFMKTLGGIIRVLFVLTILYFLLI